MRGDLQQRQAGVTLALGKPDLQIIAPEFVNLGLVIAFLAKPETGCASPR